MNRRAFLASLPVAAAAVALAKPAPEPEPFTSSRGLLVEAREWYEKRAPLARVTLLKDQKGDALRVARADIDPLRHGSLLYNANTGQVLRVKRIQALGAQAIVRATHVSYGYGADHYKPWPRGTSAYVIGQQLERA